MKIKVYSLLVSLVFIPVAILGQFLGLYLGKILYFIYERVMSLRLPDFIQNPGPVNFLRWQQQSFNKAKTSTVAG